MFLSLSTFYLIYLALVVVFLMFSFFNVYHLLRFGSPSAVTLTMSVLYLIGTCILLGTSFLFLRGIDWSLPIELIPTSPGGVRGL